MATPRSHNSRVLQASLVNLDNRIQDGGREGSLRRVFNLDAVNGVMFLPAVRCRINLGSRNGMGHEPLVLTTTPCEEIK